MVQTFSYKTVIEDKIFYQTIYSTDIESSVEKWIVEIEQLQNQVYSFNTRQVHEIKQQYLSNQLQIQVEYEPNFLKYKRGEVMQVVNIQKVNKGCPDFIAEVTYLQTAEGGRTGYAMSGYRPHIKFDGRCELTSGEQLFIDKEKVFPGDKVIAEIRIVGKDFFSNYLFVGQHFELVKALDL